MFSRSARLRARAERYFGVRKFVYCVAIAVSFVATAPAKAQNKFWILTTSGQFPTAANWSTSAGGAGGSPAPGAGEIANFTLGNTYTVSYAGNVTNAGLNVSGGTVTLDLNGFLYSVTGASGTLIGTVSPQTGRLIVKDGTFGVDTAGDDVVVGAVVGGTGFMTISTSGQLGGGLDPDLVVGGLGTGTFAIEDNGRAEVVQMNVGQNEGSSGTVTLNTPNALLDVSSTLNVGVSGNGVITAQGGSTLTTTGAVTIGNFVGGKGTLTVAGVGTTWTSAGALTVGDGGDAGVSIQTGAQVTTAGAINIGNTATGTGAAVATGTDAVWNMSSNLNLGVTGIGNMAATAGGRINTTGATVMSVNGGESTAVVTGANSRWTTSAITVGNAGNATLSVSAAGVINTTGNAIVANTATSTSKATISGTGSAWNITGGLTVAATGNGTLTVDTGGTLTTTGTLTLSDPAGTPNGTFNFQGGNVNVASFVRSATSNFNFTDGTMIINGGSFNNGGAALVLNGADADDLPAIRLASGATSVAANLPTLTIGSSRQGGVVVSGGSSFQTTTTSIGAQDGSNGALLVEGVNSVFSTTGDLNVGGGAATGGGIGTVTAGISGTITAGGALRLWNGATINMSGGTVNFNTLVANGGRVNFSSGTLRANANFAANVATMDAILGPTHSLGAGRRIDVPANTLILSSDLSVDGGTVTGNVLSVAANVLTTIQAGGRFAANTGIVNSAGARMFVTDASVDAGPAMFNNSGELHLGGTSATVTALNVANAGLITGNGRLNSVVTDTTAGSVRVGAGERLQILGASGTNLNDGLIDVDGGEIEFGRAVTNSTVSPSTGLIAARNATLRFSGGLTNSGSLSFTAGVSDVFGDVSTTDMVATPGRTGRIVVTGGAQANFFDDVANSGIIQVSAAGSLKSTAVFLGSLSGNGVSGTGQVFIEGDMRPGFSPGTMAFGGDLSYGPLAALNIELAGTTPGTQYDRVTVAGDVALAGTLDVSLLSGFKPSAGNSFSILTAGGSINGTFDDEILPQLNGGLKWDINYAAQSVSLNVGGVLGDYNLDGTVDSADYVVWRKLLDTNTIVADGSGNGTVDQADYDIWRNHIGQVASSGSGAGTSTSLPANVPEPSTVILAVLFMGLSLMAQRRKRRK